LYSLSKNLVVKILLRISRDYTKYIHSLYKNIYCFFYMTNIAPTIFKIGNNVILSAAMKRGAF
ncbi:MAG: hypothetical protein KAJ15_11035, partial [Spirochaetes bacterium]|nr:hypothetical protein [Spirochaetota bacterium]